jgi:hypothetical protein
MVGAICIPVAKHSVTGFSGGIVVGWDMSRARELNQNVGLQAIEVVENGSEAWFRVAKNF